MATLKKKRRPYWPDSGDPDAWPVGAIRAMPGDVYEIQGVNGRYFVYPAGKSCSCPWGRCYWQSWARACWHKEAVAAYLREKQMEKWHRLAALVRLALGKSHELTIGARAFLAVPDQDMLAVADCLRECEAEMRKGTNSDGEQTGQAPAGE